MKSPLKVAALRRPAVVVIVALLAAEALYVGTAELVLRSRAFAGFCLGPARRTHVSFAAVHSPWPGFFVARDLEVRGRTAGLHPGGGVDWWIAARKASGWFDPFSLAVRRMSIPLTHASGVRVKVRRTAAEALGPEIVAALPEMPALPGDPSRAHPPKHRWSFEIARLISDDVEEVWIDQYRVSGRIAASGGFRVRAGRDAEVLPARVSLDNVQLALEPKVVATAISGQLRGRLSPWIYRTERQWDVLPHVVATADLDGRLVDLSFAELFFGSLEWLHLGGGEGPFRLALNVVDGRLATGSRCELPPRELAVSAFDYEAKGTGSLLWEMEPDGAAHHLHGELPAFAVQRKAETEAYLRGNGLTLDVRSTDLTLDGKNDPPAVDIVLPAGEVPSLAVYDRYLPPRLGVEVRGGHGRLTSRFHSGDGHHGEATVDLEAVDAEVGVDPLVLRGKLKLAARLVTTELANRRFDLAGSTLSLTDLAVEGADAPCRDWWAKVEIDSGWVQPGAASSYLEIAARAHLRDSLPLVTLLAARKPLPGWLQRRLAVERVEAKLDLGLARDGLNIRRLTAQGERLRFDARFALHAGNRRAQLLAQYGRLALGIALDHGKRDFVLSKPRAWFAAGEAAWPALAPPPTAPPPSTQPPAVPPVKEPPAAAAPPSPPEI